MGTYQNRRGQRAGGCSKRVGLAISPGAVAAGAEIIPAAALLEREAEASSGEAVELALLRTSTLRRDFAAE